MGENFVNHISYKGFPDGSEGKESGCSEGDLGLIPGSGRFPGEGNGNSLHQPGQFHDRGAQWDTGHWGHKESGHN